jgi:hypothetical protein
VELGLRPDEPDGINSNGTLSIFTTMLDADAPVGGSPPASDGSPRNLAAIGRELAFNDFQQIIDLKTGGPDDRNKELQLAMPFSIAPLLDLSENWNEVSAPNLAAGWNSYAAGGNGWVTASDGASNMARVDDPSFVTDRWLESPVFVPAGDQVVGFTQTVNLEAYAAGGVGYDGTVLEISIGGAPYQDILAAGGRFDAGGYNLVISSGYQSPILGRRAWSGQSANRQYVQVRLPPAAGGRSTRLRWRVATDNSGLSSGYSVDDIHVSDLKCGETFGSPGSAIVCGAGETCSAGICTFDLTQNLLGHWPLNDASGSTTAADSSGHNLTGTVVGNVQFSANAGPNGTGAALFRGGNASGSPPGSYIDVSFPATAAGSGTGAYMPLGNVSYSMWFQTSNVNAPIQGIQEIWASTARGPMGYDRIIGNGGNGPLYYNSWSEVSFAGTKTVNDGQWHHVVYVFDQTNGFYAYVDGILDGYSVAPTANANGCAGIGCSNFNWATDYLIGTGGNGRFGALGFNGYISDVRIYNVPLAATGVQALYSANLPPPRGGGPGGGGACVPNRNPCQPGECAGSEPDGCGGFVDCHADCSVNGNVCPRAGGVCRANVCVCSTLNPS